MVKVDLKRLLKYIFVTIAVSAVLFHLSLDAAYAERGYHAMGGEAFIPGYVVMAAVTVYNRKK